MDKADKIIRFDDVCLNSDYSNTVLITRIFQEKGFKVIWAVSPLVHDNVGERVFPKILNAYSDFRHFYKVDQAGIPAPIEGVTIASHGIVHVDHRMLGIDAQEMSILVSCSLLKSNMFVPPFNKWTKSMQIICEENGIELVMFEDGWRSCEFNEYDQSHNLWYLHAREWTVEKMDKWLGY